MTTRAIPRILMAVAAATLLWQPAAAHSQEAGGALEARFLDYATAQLDLNTEQRAGLSRVVRQTMERRRDLVRRRLELRRRVRAALADPSADPSDFKRLTEDIAHLKRDEADLIDWQRRELGDVLDPRQTLRFLMMEQRMAERVAAARSRQAGARRGAGRGRR